MNLERVFNMSKILFIMKAMCILFLSNSVSAQEYYVNNIHPLKSKQSDVNKILGEPTYTEKNKARYDKQDREITITYYDSGCNSEWQDKLGIQQSTVIEMKVVHRLTQSVSELPFATDIIRYPSEDRLYLSLDEKIVVVGSKKDNDTLVKAIYYVPSEKKLPLCLIRKMAAETGFIFLKEHPLSENSDESYFRPRKVSGFSNAVPLSYRKHELDKFVKELEHSPDSKGYIFVYGFEQSDSKTSTYIRQLKTYLIEEKKINTERLVFVNSNGGSSSKTELLIFPKGTEPE